MKTRLKFALVLFAVAILGTGCSHQLEVKNLDSYQNLQINHLNNPMTIGMVPSAQDIHSQRLIRGVGTALQKFSAKVILPYYPAAGTQKADILANITVSPEYKGSGWNFLINWPGFLIWTPAWHGYVYKANFNVNITLMNGIDNKNIDSWSLPINLSLRHADIGRTWTEIGWLEVSVIPFIGGFVFIQYDPDVTPDLITRIENPIGDYIAQDIVKHINEKLGSTISN